MGEGSGVNGSLRVNSTVLLQTGLEIGVVLLVGARMAPDKRTVTAVLRIMVLSQERIFDLRNSHCPSKYIKPSKERPPTFWSLLDHLIVLQRLSPMLRPFFQSQRLPFEGC
jgi:hypothetical protein